MEHTCGRLAQPTLDLREVRIRDTGEVRELAHAQLAQLALAADDLAELGRTHLSRHRRFTITPDGDRVRLWPNARPRTRRSAASTARRRHRPRARPSGSSRARASASCWR